MGCEKVHGGTCAARGRLEIAADGYCGLREEVEVKN